MKIGIMQPYFFPYIGYWQLMNAVDKYVIYDDVNYINRGWINRNRILVNGQPRYFNVPMLGASQNKLINEICVSNDEKLIERNLRIIENAYQKAPHFAEVFPLVKQILKCGERNLARYLEVSFRVICSYLNIQTELIVSSSLEKNCSLKGQDKILSICQLLQATEYYNAIGGANLYSYEDFNNKKIQLFFLKTEVITYKQFDNKFQENLSIIDAMMFMSREQVQKCLDMYTLIGETDA